MPQFEFWLGNEDTNRLFAAKELEGKDNLTGNDFARELLIKELHKRHPKTVKYDENGEIIN